MHATLSTRHLLLLVTLDEVGTLHAAARKLYLTPSALSQQLRDLEHRLGGPLFQRDGRRLVITAAGRHLTDAAQAMLGELARAEAETRSLLSGASGTVRVTTACHQSYRWLSNMLQSFVRSWPRVEVVVVSEAAAAPCEWIAERKLDVAIVPGEIRHDARVHIEPLFADEAVAVVGSSHPWCTARSIDLHDLEEQHVWTDEGAFRGDTPLGRGLEAAGATVPRRVTSVPMTTGVALDMARAGLGVAILPLWAAEPTLSEGGLHAVRLGADGIRLQWSVAVRAGSPGPTLAAFLDVLRRHHPRARARSS